MSLPEALASQLHIKHSARRKTLGLRFYPDRIQVNAPASISRAEVLALLAPKHLWLQRRLAEARARFGDRPEHSYQAGARMLFLGADYPLAINTGSHTAVQLSGGALQITLSRRGRRPQAARARDAMAAWYQQQALALLSEKSRALAAQCGLAVAEVKVKYTRSKWGHCTSRGELQYNWLIVQAPVAIVDYLVAHEVSHLRHPNHSAAFWSQVATLCPDYLAARRWLKSHGHRLCM